MQRHGATSRSPRRCAAKTVRRCYRCSTPVSQTPAAGRCDTGCRIRNATVRPHASAIGAIAELHDALPRCRDLGAALKQTVDIERIAARIALRSARPRDLSGLRDTLGFLPSIAEIVSPFHAPLISDIACGLVGRRKRGRRSSGARSPPSLRPCFATATSSRPAATRTSTSFAQSTPTAARSLCSSRRASASEPVSRRSKSSTTASTASISRSRMRTSPEFPRISAAAKR